MKSGLFEVSQAFYAWIELATTEEIKERLVSLYTTSLEMENYYLEAVKEAWRIEDINPSRIP